MTQEKSEKPETPERAAGGSDAAYRLGATRGATSPGLLSSLELQTLGQALERCVSLWGNREFLVFPSRRYRAAELLDEVNRFARGLLSFGVAAGEHVGVWLPNLPEYVVTEFALAKIGAAMVPINTRYKAAELEFVLRQSDSTTLLFMPQFGDTDYLRVLHEVFPEWEKGPRGRPSGGALPHLKRVISVQGHAPGTLSYEELLERGDAPGLNAQLEAREAAVSPTDTVILQYTSGTTAFPKAVMLSHGQVLRNAYQMARRAGFVAADRVLSAMPMFHVGGTVCALLGAVTMGHTLYLAPAFDPGETLRTIEEEKITAYIGIESMFIALRAHEDFPRRSRATLSKGWSAGTSSVLRMVAEEIGIRNICSLYGLSEASPNVAITDWRDPYDKRLATMGRPQPGVEVKIVDPETGEIMKRGERGEICVRGWSVMKGYYNQPEETARVIDSQGWLHTGDVGFLDADGFLVWTGRLKDTLRVGGENVSALEVENLLCSHPAVLAAAVVGMPDERLREVPAAFLQLRPGAAVTAEEIVEFCQQRVAGFKVPRLVRFVARFEMTGSGKIQKYALRERLLAELDLNRQSG